MSLTVTGICKLDKLALAAFTWLMRSFGLKTQSNSGSEPNCRTRVTNLALGFAWSAANKVSLRPFHSSPPSNPN